MSPWAYCPDNSRSNLVTACQRCNSIAGAKVFKDFDEKWDFIRIRLGQLGIALHETELLPAPDVIDKDGKVFYLVDAVWEELDEDTEEWEELDEDTEEWEELDEDTEEWAEEEEALDAEYFASNFVKSELNYYATHEYCLIRRPSGRRCFNLRSQCSVHHAVMRTVAWCDEDNCVCTGDGCL